MKTKKNLPKTPKQSSPVTGRSFPPPFLSRLFSDKHVSDKAAFGLHGLLAVILFSPFFVLGKFIIGSTDNYYHLYPNMITHLRAFQNGEWGLWNPFIFTGIDFSASPHHLIYYPVNWLIFLFPEKYLFLLMTVRMFCEVWLVGVFGFLLFKTIFRESPPALLASIAYQLGGYLFFSITTYPNLTVFLLSTISTWVLFSLPRRRPWAAFLTLSLCTAGILLCCNTVYSLAALLNLTVLFLYKYFSGYWKSPQRWRHLGVPVLGVICGLLISTIHLWPFARGLLSGSSRVEAMHLQTTPGGVFLGLTALVPEAMGVNYRMSFPLIKGVTGIPIIHSQNAALNYIGILPAVLLIWAAFRVRKKELVFWWAYLIFAVGWYLRISPFSDILNLAFYPFLHEIMPHMMIPLPVCVIAGFSAGQLIRHPFRFDGKSVTAVFGILCLTVLCLPPLYSYSFSALIKPLRLTLLILSALMALTPVLLRFLPGIKRHAALWLPSLGLMFGGSLALSLLSRAGDSSLVIGVVDGAATIAVLSVFWLLIEWSMNRPEGTTRLLTALGGSLALTLILYSPLVHWAREHAFRCLVPVGIIRLFLVFLMISALVRYAQTQKLNRAGLTLGLLIILVIDLTGHNKVYSYIIKEPFFKGSTLYGDKTAVTSQMNLRDYRVNVPNVYLGILNDPLYFSNIPAVYGVRAFGGVNSDIPKRHQQLMDHFDRNMGTGKGIDVRIYNRMLDVLGCGYNIDRNGRREIRPQALSRLMLFHNFEVIPDDQAALDRLTSRDFDPLSTLVLDSPPGQERPEREIPARPLHFKEKKSSLITVGISTKTPALLYFGDSYHPGWKAFVDGKPAKILRADFKFMAVALPAGTESVTLQFAPRTFVVGRNITVFGLILTLILTLGLTKLKKITSH